MLRVIAPLIVCCAAVALGGCAAIEKWEAQTAENVMSASGFARVPANTPERVNALQTMKPRTFSVLTENGTRYWVYPDPSCGCLFAGTEKQYQQYRKAIIERNIVNEKRAAAQQATDFDWALWGRY